jgi:HSP20 family molecular chaperone IbpA
MPQERVAITLEDTADPAAVDRVIGSVERLYASLTGSPPPHGDQVYAPIPIERDAGEFVEKRMEQLIRALEVPVMAGGQAWAPPIVVWEGDRETVACLDLPGVQRADVEVVEENGMLTVTGRRQAAYDGQRLQRAERPLGLFRRHILLPRGGKIAGISAKLQDGVLEIRIPKEAGAGVDGRKIEVT